MADSLLDIFAGKQQQQFDILAATEVEEPIMMILDPLPADPVVVTKTEEPAVVEEKPKKKKRAPAVHKTPTEKTAKKTDSDKKKKKKKPSTEKTAATNNDGRHQSGYAMLKTECDKLDRIITGLKRKRDNRIDSGKPISTVCGIHNDRLLNFFKHVRSEFDTEFAKYMSA